MKIFFALTVLFLACLSLFAQKPDDILATATGHTFRFADLPPATQNLVMEVPARIKTTRTALLDQMINQRLLDAEAAASNMSVAKLISDERAKVPAPTEAEIKAVYESRKDALGGQTLEQVREPIVKYLRGQTQQKKFGELFARLRAKYKFIPGKDINAVGLSDSDIVANVNGKAITDKEFEDLAKSELFDLRASFSDQILNDLNDAITSALTIDEARSLGITPDALLAREITDKMKDFSDDERDVLTDALRQRLYPKYQVKTLYKGPEPFVQNISVGNGPGTGPANAPVTIVMFSDFQCSACSATHPVLKKAMALYPGKIRFIVRNFPLESIHEHAWRAALAAAAANAQGKFFEYTEVLYTHQDALDDVSLKKYAAELGLNAKQFELDFNSEKTAAQVRKDMTDGEAYGLNGTPTIYVNGVRVRNLSTLGFRNAIDTALQK